MRRTTVYLEPELEVLLKLATQREKRSMADLIREAVRTYVTREPRTGPPGAGEFASGRADTAERVDEVLAKTGFGVRATPPRRPKRRA